MVVLIAWSGGGARESMALRCWSAFFIERNRHRLRRRRCCFCLFLFVFVLFCFVFFSWLDWVVQRMSSQARLAGPVLVDCLCCCPPGRRRSVCNKWFAIGGSELGNFSEVSRALVRKARARPTRGVRHGSVWIVRSWGQQQNNNASRSPTSACCSGGARAHRG